MGDDLRDDSAGDSDGADSVSDAAREMAIASGSQRVSAASQDAVPPLPTPLVVADEEEDEDEEDEDEDDGGKTTTDAANEGEAVCSEAGDCKGGNTDPPRRGDKIDKRPAFRGETARPRTSASASVAECMAEMAEMAGTDGFELETNAPEVGALDAVVYLPAAEGKVAGKAEVGEGEGEAEGLLASPISSSSIRCAGCVPASSFRAASMVSVVGDIGRSCERF